MPSNEKQREIDVAVVRLEANLAMWRRHHKLLGAAPPCASGQPTQRPQSTPAISQETAYEKARRWGMDPIEALAFEAQNIPNKGINYCDPFDMPAILYKDLP